MAYENLKDAIKQVIKQNGNQEITGSILQNALVNIINTIGEGATFAGIATPETDPGTPDGNVFYLAFKAGDYVNFSNTHLEFDGLFVFSIHNSKITVSNLENSRLDGPVRFKLKNGYINYITGNYFSTAADISCIDVFPCLPNTAYSVKKTENVKIRQSVYYDKDMQIIGSSHYYEGDGKQPITTPKNTAFMALNVDNSAYNDKSADVIGKFDFRLIRFFDLDTQANVSNLQSDYPFLLHILVLGQSLSMGYATGSALDKPNTKKAYMFKQVRSQDFGYIFNITKDVYNSEQDKYDSIFYKKSILKESGGNGYSSSKWEDASANEFETPCSGIVEGLVNMYKANGYEDIPFSVLCSAPGIGGTAISSFDDDTDKIVNRAKTDIQHGLILANDMNISYQLAIVWIQGENNYSTEIDAYVNSLKLMYDNLIRFTSKLGIDNAKVYSYQTSVNPKSRYSTKSQKPALAQFKANELYNWFKLAYPIYNLKPANDFVHLTNVSSRALGLSIGKAIFHDMNGDFETLKIIKCEKVNKTNLILKFNKSIVNDYQNLDRTGQSDEDNNSIQSNFGFYAFDINGLSVINSTIIKNNEVHITCSSEPVKLIYGAKSENGYTIGGTIRENITVDGYNNQKVYFYMPVQVIDTFDTKFNY